MTFINDSESLESVIVTNSPEVSVIGVTYNQNLSKTIRTLESIVIQENVSFEIIICDDGSEKCFEKEIRAFFSKTDFCRYSLVFHEHNGGTVSNYYSGLTKAKGRYSKLLGSGDCLVDRKTLYNWVHFMNDNNVVWSFSDTIYYRFVNGKAIPFQTKAMPQVIRPYITRNKAKCAWNYIVLHDIANGASILGVTHIQKEYCEVLKEKGIRYCEDLIYKLMMFYGEVGDYYPSTTVYYEYGDGISSSGDLSWRGRILEDKHKLDQIMFAKKDDSAFQGKLVNGLVRNSKSNKINKYFIKGRPFLWIKQHFFPRLTNIPDEVGE